MLICVYKRIKNGIKSIANIKPQVDRHFEHFSDISIPY